PTKLERSATTALRYRAGGELAFARALLREVLTTTGGQRLGVKAGGLDELRKAVLALDPARLAEEAGVSQAAIAGAAKAFLEAEHGIIMYGAEARSFGPALVEALGSLAALAGKAGRAGSGLIALLPGGNSRGALDMGVRPDARPGYAPTAQRGLGARELWGAAQDGRVRAIWVAGLDPAASLPAARAALAAAELVVVQDMFLTATAQLADVVLPAASVAEREGSYTNAERRVQRSRAARGPLGQSRPDWQIVQGVALQLVGMLAPQRAAQAQGAKGGKGAGATAVAVAEPGGWAYLTVGELAFDVASRQAACRETPIDLSRREGDLLEILMRRAGSVVTRGSLEESLYAFNEPVTPNAVEVAVSRLRRKLDDAGCPGMLHTVRGLGYLMRDAAA
ncbi:MAG: molybdopterin-dependent oxidoreductase, partial [Brevundimonas sp.]|nr:molybdopterin-dependent oxidoreductase [Brevundimonas sp.]